MERPLIGIIVEGRGEYHTYPMLINKCLGVTGMFVPIVTADGCGNIFKRLQEQLEDLVASRKPINVLVTVDLIDAIKQGYAIDKDELEQKLQDEVDKCIHLMTDNPKYDSLPSRIVCIAQVQKFESWLLSDVEGLRDAGLLASDAPTITDPESVANPNQWLKKFSVDIGSVKKPRAAKKVAGALCVDTMALNSPSFNLFKSSCQAMYRDWVDSFS